MLSRIVSYRIDLLSAYCIEVYYNDIVTVFVVTAVVNGMPAPLFQPTKRAHRLHLLEPTPRKGFSSRKSGEKGGYIVVALLSFVHLFLGARGLHCLIREPRTDLPGSVAALDRPRAPARMDPLLMYQGLRRSVPRSPGRRRRRWPGERAPRARRLCRRPLRRESAWPRRARPQRRGPRRRCPPRRSRR